MPYYICNLHAAHLIIKTTKKSRLSQGPDDTLLIYEFSHQHVVVVVNAVVVGGGRYASTQASWP